MPQKLQSTKYYKKNNANTIRFVPFRVLVFLWQNFTSQINTGIVFNVSQRCLKNRPLLNYFSLLFLSAFLTSCSFQQKEAGSGIKSSGTKYAKGFTLERKTHYKKLVILNPWDNYKPYATYFIFKDSLKPELEESELSFYFYETPKSIALHTAAQAATLSILDLDKYIKGITDPRFFYEQKYADKLDSGLLIQTSNQVQLNQERILLLHPEIVITSGWNTINSDYQMLIKTGIPPLFMIEWMETNPLGRAEWIKVLGFLFDKEKEADSIFQMVEKNYLAIKNQTKRQKVRPQILHGEEYNGVWYVAGGQSYIAQIYKDAGADYLWKDNDKTGSLPIDFEMVLKRGASADFWFTTFSQNTIDIEHIKQEKYSILKSVKEQKIYSNSKRIRKMGGNDFWETGSFRPDIILQDIVQIIHPENKKKDSLFFYKRLSLKD